MLDPRIARLKLGAEAMSLQTSLTMLSHYIVRIADSRSRICELLQHLEGEDVRRAREGAKMLEEAVELFNQAYNKALQAISVLGQRG